jgi:hypothetical protein
VNAPLGCRDCSNTIEPYANDGDGPYRTGDQAGRCAACNSTAVCACCGESFECADPSDPDNATCPGCAAEPSGVECDHVNATCASCERH